MFNSRDSPSLMQLALQFRLRTNPNQSFNRSNMSGYLSPYCDSVLNTSHFGLQDSKNTDVAELYYTDTFIQTVTEFWLNSFFDGPSSRDRSMLQPSLPSVDHVCLVRVFLKHCHHFSYAKTIPVLVPETQLDFDFVTKLHRFRQ